MSVGNDVSMSNPGPNENTPYAPDWCYDKPRPYICTTCGCRENYHHDSGPCLNAAKCGCTGYTGPERF